MMKFLTWALFCSMLGTPALGQIPDRATVQMARAKCVADAITGVCTILLKVPTGDRKVSGGLAWFELPGFEDTVEVYISDEDNILGLGAGVVIAGYTDVGVPVDNRGWFIPKLAPYITVEKLVEFGTIKGGLYLKIIGRKGIPSADTLRLNVHWGKPG